MLFISRKIPRQCYFTSSFISKQFRQTSQRRKLAARHRPPRNETFLHRNYKHRSPNLFSPICSSQSSMRNRCGDRKFVWKPKNGIQGGETRIRSIRAGAQDFIIQDAAGNGRKNCEEETPRRNNFRRRGVSTIFIEVPLFLLAFLLQRRCRLPFSSPRG